MKVSEPTIPPLCTMPAFANFLIVMSLCLGSIHGENVNAESLDLPMDFPTAKGGEERSLEARRLFNTQTSWTNDAGCSGGTFAFKLDATSCTSYSCEPAFGSARIISTGACTCMNSNDCFYAWRSTSGNTASSQFVCSGANLQTNSFGTCINGGAVPKITYPGVSQTPNVGCAAQTPCTSGGRCYAAKCPAKSECNPTSCSCSSDSDCVGSFLASQYTPQCSSSGQCTARLTYPSLTTCSSCAYDPDGNWCTGSSKCYSNLGSSLCSSSLISLSSNCPATSCSSGQYLSGGVCLSCSAGYYNPTAGSSSSCQICPVNAYSSSSGATSCSSCPSGLTSPQGSTSSSACVAAYSCNAGQYNTNGGSTSSSCSTCGANTYSLSGATSCTACPSGQSSSQGSTSSSACTASSSTCSSCIASLGYWCPTGSYSGSCVSSSYSCLYGLVSTSSSCGTFPSLNTCSSCAGNSAGYWCTSDSKCYSSDPICASATIYLSSNCPGTGGGLTAGPSAGAASNSDSCSTLSSGGCACSLSVSTFGISASTSCSNVACNSCDSFNSGSASYASSGISASCTCKLGTGIIAGIVVGAVVLLVLIGVAIYCCCRRPKTLVSPNNQQIANPAYYSNQQIANPAYHHEKTTTKKKKKKHHHEGHV